MGEREGVDEISDLNCLVSELMLIGLSFNIVLVSVLSFFTDGGSALLRTHFNGFLGVTEGTLGFIFSLSTCRRNPLTPSTFRCLASWAFFLRLTITEHKIETY